MADRPHPIPGTWSGPGSQVVVHKNTDKSWGKGMWHSMYETAKWSDTPNKVNYFCDWVRDQCANLPCVECTTHATAYIATHPPEAADDVFVWLWQFENDVNKRIGKPQVSFVTRRDEYYGGKIKQCPTCGGGQPDKVNMPIRK